MEQFKQFNIEKQATDVLPLAEGGEMTKAQVVKHLEDVIDLIKTKLIDKSNKKFEKIKPHWILGESGIEKMK